MLQKSNTRTYDTHAVSNDMAVRRKRNSCLARGTFAVYI
jgi:hypothetical protein